MILRTYQSINQGVYIFWLEEEESTDSKYTDSETAAFECNKSFNAGPHQGPSFVLKICMGGGTLLQSVDQV